MYPDTYTSSATVPTGIAAAMGGFFLFLFIFFVVLAVFYLVCMWRIFVKAGKPGWAALIPVYNFYILMQIIGKPWWWMFGYFLGIIPAVGPFLVIAFGVVVALELAHKFGKSNAFGVVALWLFSFVGYPILAFGSAQYDPSAPAVVNFPADSVTSVSNVAQSVPQAPVQDNGMNDQSASPVVPVTPVNPVAPSSTEPFAPVEPTDPTEPTDIPQS